MKVIVSLSINYTDEFRLIGDSPIFGDGIDYKNGVDSHLRDIGFWITGWRFAGSSGPNHKSRVFIPWGSCLLVECPE